MKTLMVTGHRQVPPMAADWVADSLYQAIQRALHAGFQHFISGGALGVDQWFAQMILMEMRKSPELTLTIAKPFPSQDKKWAIPERIYFLQMCKEATVVKEISEDPYDVRKIYKRNEWMTRQADAVVAVLAEEKKARSGTGQMIRLARKQGLPVYQIDPVAQSSAWM